MTLFNLINLALIFIRLSQYEALKCAFCAGHCARDGQFHHLRKCEGKNAACTILFDIRHDLIDARDIKMKTNVTLKGCVNLSPKLQNRNAKKEHCHCKTGQAQFEHVSTIIYLQQLCSDSYFKNVCTLLST
jgi:hypothetical protein